MTPRDFAILLRAQEERQYDEIERKVAEVMMMRQAYHTKQLRASDLFKRPSDGGTKEIETLKEKTRLANDWLATLQAQKGDVT